MAAQAPVATQTPENVIVVQSQHHADILRHLYVVKEILELRQFNVMPKPGRVIDLQAQRDALEICDTLHRASAGQTGIAWLMAAITDMADRGQRKCGVALLSHFAYVAGRARVMFVVAA
jgi:hypothetical protein